MRTCGELKSIAAMATFHLTTKFGSKSRGERGVDKFDYINRNGRFAKKHEGPLVYALSGNMPSWAANDPREFWIEADEYERANGALYHEIEFALPRELSLDQQIAAAHEFAQQIVGSTHPYSLGMHGNESNPHVHLIFCGRKQDGIERNPDLFFKRANKKNPELGGCIKTSTEERGKEWVIQIRQDWQDIANKHLEAAGENERIDCRSHADRGLDIAPGIHIGRRAIRTEQKGRLTRKGEINRSIAGVNAQLRNTQTQIHQENKNGRKRILGRVTENLRAADRNIAAARRNHPTADQVRGAIHARSLTRAITAHHSASGRDRGEVDCNENLDRRQQYKSLLVQKHYHAQISTALAVRLAFVNQEADQLTISLKGGGHIIDRGDRLSTRYGNSSEAKATIELALAKGWKQIRVTGSQKFKAQIYIEAIRAGLTVDGYEPSADLRAKLEKEKNMLGQAGAVALTPDVMSGEKPNNRWKEPLRTVREKLEAEHKAIKERLQELHEIDIQKLKNEIAFELGGAEYKEAVRNARSKAQAAKSAGFITAPLKNSQAEKARLTALQLQARVLALPDAQQRLAAAVQQNQERERLNAQLIPVKLGVGEILYWEGQIARGISPEKDFQEMWNSRKIKSLTLWQQAAIQPIFTQDSARERARLQAEAETTENLRQAQRQEQAQREIAAQHSADQIHDQLSQPNLSDDQREHMENEMRYFEELANGHDEAEARERASKKSNAPRPR